MKNKDALAIAIAELGITDFFSVTGGAALNIIDSLINTGKINPIFHHHEQAAALAADAYARIRGLGLCVVTTGPGVTNTLTGLLCSWQDSVPTIFISGQARSNQTAQGLDLRQVGTQHLEVLPIVKHLTKKSHMLNKGESVADVIADLAEIAVLGRPGPVWLDIPLDLQFQEEIPSKRTSVTERKWENQNLDLAELLNDIEDSLRPVVLVGRGLKSANKELLIELLSKLKIPVLRTWGFQDVGVSIPESIDFGAIGVSGQRGANIIIEESDLIISIGCRLSQAVVGPDINQFSPLSKKYVVDLDKSEIERLKISINFNSIFTDSNHFINKLSETKIKKTPNPRWIEYCKKLKILNHEQLLEARHDYVDLYYFLNQLKRKSSNPTHIVVDGGGTIVYSSMQILDPGENYNVVIPSASAPMGTGLPHGIGVKIAEPNSKVVVLSGDGSFAFNLQELQTLITNSINVTIFILNNSGYLSIRETQDQFLDSRYLGSDKTGLLELPDFEKIANAFDIEFTRIHSDLDVNIMLEKVLSNEKLNICELMLSPIQRVFPTMGFRTNSLGIALPAKLSQMDPIITELPQY